MCLYIYSYIWEKYINIVFIRDTSILLIQYGISAFTYSDQANLGGRITQSETGPDLPTFTPKHQNGLRKMALHDGHTLFVFDYSTAGGWFSYRPPPPFPPSLFCTHWTHSETPFSQIPPEPILTKCHPSDQPVNPIQSPPPLPPISHRLLLFDIRSTHFRWPSGQGARFIWTWLVRGNWNLLRDT